MMRNSASRNLATVAFAQRLAAIDGLAGDAEARYLLIMTPRIANLIGAIHAPGADVPAVFAEHDSEVLPTAE